MRTVLGERSKTARRGPLEVPKTDRSGHRPGGRGARPLRLAGALVHLLDQVLVLPLHDRSLQLQAGGDLPVLDVEVAGQQTELLDGLPALETLVELLDVAVDHLDGHGRRDDLGVGLALQAVLLRPLHDRDLVEGDERRAEVPVGAVDQDVGDVGADRLELALDLGRRDVLAAGGLDQVLLAVGDAQVAVGRELADVAGVEPAVALQHLGGLLGQLVVALHDAGAAQQDLAVVRDAHLGAGQRLADRAGAVGLAGIDEGRGGGLGEAVPLQDVDAGAGEEEADLRGEGGRAGHAGPQAAAEGLADLGVDELVGDGVLGAQAGRGARGAGALEVVLGDLRVLAGDPGGPLEDLVLGSAAGAGLGGDAVVDLLEDARDGRHVGRLHDRQVLDDLVDAAVDGGDVTGFDLAGGEHLAEDVREGQPQVLHVVLGDQAGRGDRLRHVRPVVVRETHPLGAAGGAGGVDEGGELVLGERAHPLPDQLRVRLQTGRTPALQVVEGQHPVLAGVGTGRVDHHDVGELGQLAALLPRLGELGGVLRDQDPALGVGEDVRRLLGVGLRVDRGRRGARAHDAEVGEDPLQPGGGGEGHALLGLHTEFDQSGRDGVDAFGGLGPGQRLPVVRALTRGRRHRVAVRLGVRRGRHPLQEESRHGGRTVLDQCLCVAHDILRGPATARLAQVRLDFTLGRCWGNGSDGCPITCLTHE
ncbi:hypothetical protein SAM23877_2606 [Streptomyces ambofaciens ATCC 23877]|uniref:Uncharacterized protein n=1 Tax=Streptomyces ambofaciens (strain ATCC 23877 / 3486 / DSM 40053 / JCM 4204 / NBRC 12836 / NRRL B-2516) TaxID=278992 RepID=A0A0K2ARA3_STRA7|nr:hypothetical protein SAM23877_2606 [Streptomyces ambofaciens ATCC 23877]